MQRIPVESSDVVAIGYDTKDRILEVEFQGQRIYQYLDVPQDIYDHFMRADSYGAYFNTFINKHYQYRRIDEGAKDAEYDAVAFVTGNTRKFHDLEAACQQFGIATEQIELPVDEIQSDDAAKVVKHKAKQAYALAGRPVVVNDAFWNILALRGFPGAYMKDVTAWFKPEDFLTLLADKQDRSISCTESLVYYDGKRSKLFSRVYWGKIIHEPRGGGESIQQLVVLDGYTQTIAEVNAISAIVKAEETVWHDFAKWYAMRQKLQSFKKARD